MWEGVSQCGRMFLNVGGCAPVWEGAPQCGKVCPRVGGCSPVWKGVPHYRRVCPSVGACAPVLDGVSQCGRVCPCMCVCEVWVFLSHVLMTDAQVHLYVYMIAGRFGHVAKAYLAKTSLNQLLLIDCFRYVNAHQVANCHNIAIGFSIISHTVLDVQPVM